jgi:undecaprenyl-diphosphatase
VATALALLAFFWRDWLNIIKALFTTLRTRRIETSTERLACLLVIATIPVGTTGLALEHVFRTLFAKPLAASIFLTINGLILFGAERLCRRAEAVPPMQSSERDLVTAGSSRSGHHASGPSAAADGSDAAPKGAGSRQLETVGEAVIIGLFQSLALLAGISRSGVSMAASLLRGLSHEDAATFSFLLATPFIFAAAS